MSTARRRLPTRRRAVVQVPARKDPTLQTADEYSQQVEWLKWEAVEKVAARVGADSGELWRAREYLLDLVPLKRRGRPINVKAPRLLLAAKVVNNGGSLNLAAKRAGIPLSTLKELAKTKPEMWGAIREIAAIKVEGGAGR